MGRLVMATEFDRGTVSQTRMRPDIILVTAVDFDQYPGLGPVAEPLHVEALSPECLVEALHQAILGGLSWLYIPQFDLIAGPCL